MDIGREVILKLTYARRLYYDKHRQGGYIKINICREVILR